MGRVCLKSTIVPLVEKEKNVRKLINGRHQVRPLLIDGHYSIGCSLVQWLPPEGIQLFGFWSKDSETHGQ